MDSVLVSDLEFLLSAYASSVVDDRWPVAFEQLSVDEVAVSFILRGGGTHFLFLGNIHDDFVGDL